MKKVVIVLLSSIVFFSCNDEQKATVENQVLTPEVKTDEQENIFVKKTEAAHSKNDFLSKDAIQFDLLLAFGGKERLNGTLTLSTDSRNALIETKTGDSIYVNDAIVYHNLDSSKAKGVRFPAYTWSYFFMLPYKLSDNGVLLNDYPNDSLNGAEYATQKLTFGENIGDAPDDWYVLYANNQTNLLHAASYIVTAGKSQEEAEKDPHAIKYGNYMKVDGIQIAHDWTFWGWTASEGLTKQLGEAKISNVSFTKTTKNTFKAPKGFTVSK